MKRCLKAPSQSINDEDLHLLPYPVVGSPKIDGFRCLIDPDTGVPKTSSMKPQPNPFVRSTLSDPLFKGLDGELTVGKPNSLDAFNRSTGPLRRKHGEPDFLFSVFDYYSPTKTYHERWLNQYKDILYRYPRLSILPQTYLYSPEDVIDFTKQCIEDNYEGAMIRSPAGLYKQGRATLKELNIFKRKPLSDREATIVGFNEKMTNLNPQTLNEMGLAKRASNQENKVGAGTLGSFVLYDPFWKEVFNCRGRINDQLALEIWQNRGKYAGRKVTYKYQAYGSIDSPRQPIFHRFYKED